MAMHVNVAVDDWQGQADGDLASDGEWRGYRTGSSNPLALGYSDEHQTGTLRTREATPGPITGGGTNLMIQPVPQGTSLLEPPAVAITVIAGKR
jgi:hypothetical protein